ncbi:hypothetical protein C0J52_10875, partial [Blattella germanica]
VPHAVNRNPLKIVYDFGSELSYECETGYVSEQKGTFVCGEDGIWIGHFVCERITCPEPQILQNGEINLKTKNIDDTYNKTENSSLSYFYNSEIENSCNIGYRLKGPSVRRCLQNSTWSLNNPYCEKISCNLSEIQLDDDVTMKNGYFNISGNYSGDWVIFRCSFGYRFILPLSSEELLWTCGLNGSWILSNTEPIILNNSFSLCKEQPYKCPEPKDPDNGYVLRENSPNNLTIGTVIKMKCRLGYILEGSDIATCQEDGTWSHDNTTCAPVQCHNPPTPNHTELTNSAEVYVYGNMLNFHCIEGYQAYGVMTSRCLANGKWSRIRGKCARK